MTIVSDYFYSTNQHAIFAKCQQPREIRVGPDAEHELTDWLVMSAIAADVGVRIDARCGPSLAFVNVYRHRKRCVLQRKVIAVQTA